MVAGPDADRVAVEDLRDVVGVDAVEREGDDAGPVVARRRAEHPQPRDLRQALQRIGAELGLVGVGGLEADPVQPLDGGRVADRLADRRRAALELRRQLGPGDLVPPHLADHRAAADERRHLLEQLAPARRAPRSPSARTSCAR